MLWAEPDLMYASDSDSDHWLYNKGTPPNSYVEKVQNEFGQELKEQAHWNLTTYTLRRAIGNPCAREEIWIKTIMAVNNRATRYMDRVSMKIPKRIFNASAEVDDAYCKNLFKRWERVSFDVPKNSEGERIMRLKKPDKCPRERSDSEFELSDEYEQ